jgi:malate synthase
MAAQIPIKGDPAANDAAMALVRADKEREVRAGHDGTWVAHPGLVPLARSVFDAGMPGPNQIDALHAEYEVHPTELIELPTGPVTDEGVRRNARVALRYLEAWFRGIGCVPIDHLMEDAATVEIARCQLWQWVHHGARLPDGSPVELARVRAHLADEVRSLGAERGGRLPPSVDRAARLIDEVVSATALEGFITERAYSELEEPKGSEG